MFLTLVRDTRIVVNKFHLFIHSPLSAMSKPLENVCDLTLVMRVRLMCGLYNHRTVPPRWQRLAQAYCIILPLTFLLYGKNIQSVTLLNLIAWIVNYTEYTLGTLVSLVTGDEYIYTFFTQNTMTDVTLDSRRIFNHLEKQIKKAFIVYVPYIMITIGLTYASIYQLNIFTVMFLIIPPTILDSCVILASATKLLILALFNARLLVLKRRLQRYGFRRGGCRQPQPYCDIYNEILQMLDNTNIPLKPLLLFDLIFGCCKLIYHLLTSIYIVEWWGRPLSEVICIMLLLSILSTKILVFSFGHIFLLESAAVHCEDMAVFTATELIKTPTSVQRQHMLAFLDALERRGARYSVLRALPLNARFLLSVLNFCIAQVIVFAKTVKPTRDS
ncbi:uncharacterized protein LOC133526705 [Cydia pomonella]|uniref:uncharacterized protein LOC133526705 n=1 Tax=Cydia pomonella TaxID=82600 RepID=UPI002ADDE422|nr:uncharacterized protein LOC133526705 [Cydia pomonella]